jgi:hypothetical protein
MRIAIVGTGVVGGYFGGRPRTEASTLSSPRAAPP